MKSFPVELAEWPAWESMQNIALSDEWFLSPGTVGRLRKFVFEIKIGPNPYKKNPSPILGDSKILRIQDRPLNPVAGHSVTAQLIVQKSPALSEQHTVDILNHKGFWLHFAKDSVEFLIEKINCVVPVPLPALAVALAWITTHLQLGARELFERRDVARIDAG